MPSYLWFCLAERRNPIPRPKNLSRQGRTLHPVEVKSKALVGRKDMRHFQALDALTDYEVGYGAIVCRTGEPYLVSEDVVAISPWAI